MFIDLAASYKYIDITDSLSIELTVQCLLI